MNGSITEILFLVLDYHFGGKRGSLLWCGFIFGALFVGREVFVLAPLIGWCSFTSI